jgi:shikimate dehydrogenase
VSSADRTFALAVADVVYVPLDTALVRLARATGCRVVDGGGMAVHQALGAFELFAGRPADAVRVREHFARLLAARGGPPADARPPA